jgi:lipopolysaccharide/colanic/teichoic acid biosynthesis glycosyltransferase
MPWQWRFEVLSMNASTMEGAEFTATALGSTRERVTRDAACRALDLLATVALLVLLLPFLLLIALIIKLDSPGPVLFRQQRVGRDRRKFLVAKFRTMQHGADHDVHRDYMLALIESGTPAPKLAGDARVTRFGGFLRRTSLDELPQLWNVLRGQMSLVGPRPPIPYEVEHYPAHWFERFAVKPGVTGLWQVSGRSEVSLEEMIELDVEYVRRRSVLLNLWILLRTAPAVLSMRGAG